MHIAGGAAEVGVTHAEGVKIQVKGWDIDNPNLSYFARGIFNIEDLSLGTLLFELHLVALDHNFLALFVAMRQRRNNL